MPQRRRARMPPTTCLSKANIRGRSNAPLIFYLLKSAIARHGKIRVNSTLLIWLNAIVRFHSPWLDWSSIRRLCFTCFSVPSVLLFQRVFPFPPNVETYIPSHNGMVLTSPYHGSDEVEENKRIGAFVAKKIGKKVYLLPRLDPESRKLAHLRQILFPTGVIPNKSPDYYIGGMLFDGKSMMGLWRSGDKKKYHNAILNHIKAAKKQADNVVLEIPTFVPRMIIGKTINGYLKQSSKNRIIIVKHGSKCYVYK